MAQLDQFVQRSFKGGMNMLDDDSRLAADEYRVGLNIRNRLDSLDLIQSSIADVNAPPGIKQEMTTLGKFQILFMSGLA